MIKCELAHYYAYKDSGVEWIGQVPAHWTITHLKRFCTKITDGAHTSPDLSSSDYPFLTVVNLDNGVLDFKNCLYTSSADYEILVRNGCQPKKHDVLYSKDGTISETAVIHENINFVVGSSFIIIRPRLKVSEPRYLCYMLQSPIMRYQARVYVKGASLPRISIFNIIKLISVLPPASEQKVIADYLDTKIAQIDHKIDLLVKKAVKYIELKQSLIYETVTRGLDKTVTMKDSGVEWIGEVPEHWDVKRVKEVSFIFNGATPKSSVAENWEGNYPWITPDDLGKLNSKFITDSKRMITKVGYESCGASMCPIGSVVISCRAPIGHIGILSIEASTNQGCKTLVLNPSIVNNLFVFYTLLSSKPKLESLGRGTTFIELSTKELGLFTFALPPLYEQKAIADYLDAKTAHIAFIIETINTLLEKLRELCKTLINDVVTGKIKVV